MILPSENIVPDKIAVEKSIQDSTKGKSKVTFSKSNVKVNIISFPQLSDFRTYIWETETMMGLFIPFLKLWPNFGIMNDTP